MKNKEDDILLWFYSLHRNGVML